MLADEDIDGQRDGWLQGPHVVRRGRPAGGAEVYVASGVPTAGNDARQGVRRADRRQRCEPGLRRRCHISHAHRQHRLPAGGREAHRSGRHNGGRPERSGSPGGRLPRAADLAWLSSDACFGRRPVCSFSEANAERARLAVERALTDMPFASAFRPARTRCELAEHGLTRCCSEPGNVWAAPIFL